jgi:hypothetical protein
MKKLLLVTARPIATPIGFIMIAMLAAAFWFVTSPTGLAQAPCTVCHKKTQTLSFPCNSIEYQRHLGHGDTMNACAVTPTENP